jgi:hypothetical protein
MDAQAATSMLVLARAAAYGDDYQSATNYPLVRITVTATGHVFYARTSGMTSMSVKPGLNSSANFVVPAGIETGAANLSVVANGIASAPVAVTLMGPWQAGRMAAVDFEAAFALPDQVAPQVHWVGNGTFPRHRVLRSNQHRKNCENYRRLNIEKFLGYFFQKRTLFLPFQSPARGLP